MPNKTRPAAVGSKYPTCVEEGHCDDSEVMRLWRQAGLPEYFLGNGGTNRKLVAFAALIREAATNA